ncbi:uncharacterized protein BX664DRAFT_327352 [Halteromyces radiatus]|uniref:uncharacterized protein n=1 Tax=Halteromyces radiatus TaxID=101107 RepID=UPI00221FB37B|nr:uncharacterized protein BX664DRAFT_327352 [Halteromyces radiatus]KAI8092474.1 hypothetical protein BX664DRAFT_327352 [Halteromyces radiatus]
MLHPLPQPQSPSVQPSSDPLDMQATGIDYSSRDVPSSHHPYSKTIPSIIESNTNVHPTVNTTTTTTTTTTATSTMTSPSSSSPVKSESPIRSCPNVSMSQPTTPRPTGSPNFQPVQSITQPSSPKEDYQLQQQYHSHEATSPYVMGSTRGKRRDSEYTSTPTFGMTKYNGNIYATDKSTILDVRIQSKVDRGFFLADNDWTCYRRNYFQISSSFSLQGVVVLYDGQDLPCLVQHQDMLHQVEQFYLGISARLSDCDKKISLVQHTAKRDKGPQSTPEPKPIRPGGNLSFSTVGANQSIVTFDRIQFKSATANNGKRRAAQQYYILVMELFAKVRSSGELISVATTESQYLVVRGRSPGHYAESHGSSSAGINDGTVGGPIRRHHHHPTLTSPPMIPGHPTSYSSHAPPPSAMYASDYSSYDYPTSAHSGNGIHYAYAPHAGVPMVPSGSSSSPNGSYEYHPPPQHPYPGHPVPPRSDHVYEYPHHPQQQHYTSLPPPMHRSESAPSTYDHFKDEGQQQWARVRMSSTPGHHHHHHHHSPNTDHAGSPFIPHASSGTPTTPVHEHPSSHHHHTYYSHHQQMPYYHHPSHYGHPESSTPVDVSNYHHGYSSHWQPWRQGNMSQQNYQQEEHIKMESKSHK